MKYCLVTSIAYVTSNTYLVLLIELQFFITFVPYCNGVWIFYNSILITAIWSL